ncbi:MAG: sigma-70 family RNA polymerase sigma factor [Cytophagales bacterium]|nr:sigma-70 family RNA polymerase sigma factor [Cytophagales bacterium]
MAHQQKKDILAEVRIVEEAKKNPQRFGILYERYYKPIYLFIYKRIDEEMIAEDICAQVFLKAMHNLSKYTYKGVPFSAWLYRIALNETNLYFRKNKTRRAVSLEDAGIYRLGEEQVFEEDEYEGQIHQTIECINQLAEKEVELLELRFFEQRSFKEIAYLLGINENTAKVRSHRLIEKMKKIIRRDGK